jgi:hypothetical protein
MKIICKRYRDDVVQKSVAIILFNISCTIEKKINENENENDLKNENERKNFVNENITIENVKMILMDDSYLNIMIQVDSSFILVKLIFYVYMYVLMCRYMYICTQILMIYSRHTYEHLCIFIYTHKYLYM